MRTFVLRARAAPTDSQKLLAAVGKEAHAEILAHTLMNAIFVAQSHRPDVTVYLVLESTRVASAMLSPLSVKLIMPPKSRICLAATAWLACDGKPGQ